MTNRGNNGQSAVNRGAKLRKQTVCPEAVAGAADKRP